MTKVMEMKVVETSAAPKAVPRSPKGVGVDRKGANACSRSLLLENTDSLGRQRYLSATSILCQRQESRSAFEVDIVPRQTKYFATSHSSVYGKDNNWPNVLVLCHFGRLF